MLGALVGYLINLWKVRNKKIKGKLEKKWILVGIIILMNLIYGFSMLDIYPSGDPIYSLGSFCKNQSLEGYEFIEDLHMVYSADAENREIQVAKSSQQLGKEEFSSLIDMLIKKRYICATMWDPVGVRIYERKIEENNEEIIITDEGVGTFYSDVGGRSRSSKVILEYKYNKDTGLITLRKF